MTKRIFSCIIYLIVAASCNTGGHRKPVPVPGPDHSIPPIPYRVIKSFPHDTASFTEGLLVHGGQLFESTGHTDSYASSRSLFGVVDSSTGIIQVKAEIDKNRYFGEGIVFLKDRIYQLTDTTHIGFTYDARTYRKSGSFHYAGEGWGLTTNGESLIMSNGSSNIVYRNSTDFAVIKTLNVTDENGPVSNINELELINGCIYANQWLTDYILKIDTSTGRVLGRLDLASLKLAARAVYPGSGETNGIAFDAAADRIYVTGKRWPRLYEIAFDH